MLVLSLFSVDFIAGVVLVAAPTVVVVMVLLLLLLLVPLFFELRRTRASFKGNTRRVVTLFNAVWKRALVIQIRFIFQIDDLRRRKL